MSFIIGISLFFISQSNGSHTLWVRMEFKFTHGLFKRKLGRDLPAAAMAHRGFDVGEGSICNKYAIYRLKKDHSWNISYIYLIYI